MDRYTLNAEDALLLIIDIQERLAGAMGRQSEVEDNTGVLIAAADALGIPVVITEQYPKGLGPTVKVLADKADSAAVFEKITFSGCTEQVLDALKSSGRRKIIIVGMETHVCVFQTVRDLLAHGYQVFVAADAVCSRTDSNRELGLSLMKEMGAVLVGTELILFDLLKQAGTAAFKELSPLIR